jgi:transposase InsO family protein
LDLLLPVLDPGPVYRRYVVGWLVAERESATLADDLIAETYRRQAIIPEKLTLSADRGSAMTSKKIALPLGRRSCRGLLESYRPLPAGRYFRPHRRCSRRP